MNTGMEKVLFLSAVVFLAACASLFFLIGSISQNITGSQSTFKNSGLIAYAHCNETPNHPDCIFQNMSCYDTKNYKKRLNLLKSKHNIKLTMRATMKDGDRLDFYTAPEGSEFWAFVIGPDNNNEEEICLVGEGFDLEWIKKLPKKNKKK